MKKMYLIILQGGGDTEIKLVNYAAKAWIESPYPARGKETIPKKVREDFEDEYEETTIHVTSGSGDNDRAMAVQGYYFDSTKSAHQYAKENSMTIENEYHGYLY
jgi:hypothetical protein